MTTEVFDPNPTIIAIAAPMARRTAAQENHSMWLSDDENFDIYDSADDKPEPIDKEILGLFPTFFFLPNKAEFC